MNVEDITTMDEALDYFYEERLKALKHHQQAQSLGDGHFGNSQYWYGYWNACERAIKVLMVVANAQDMEVNT